jgi:uncharacterized protein (TIGR03085 family)
MSAAEHRSFSASERTALADALLEAGPAAPTLCEGWTAADLAAHLVTRERRPDAGAVMVVPGLARYTEAVRRGYLKRPFTELVEMFRTGPPPWSGFALPGVDERANLTEHFVHCEDVRRGGPAWQPRELPAELQDALWHQLTRMTRIARFIPGSSHQPARLVRTGGGEIAWGGGDPAVSLHGEPAELMLYAFNRTAAARLRVDGPQNAVEAFRKRAGISAR